MATRSNLSAGAVSSLSSLLPSLPSKDVSEVDPDVSSVSDGVSILVVLVVSKTFMFGVRQIILISFWGAGGGEDPLGVIFSFSR